MGPKLESMQHNLCYATFLRRAALNGNKLFNCWQRLGRKRKSVTYQNDTVFDKNDTVFDK